MCHRDKDQHGPVKVALPEVEQHRVDPSVGGRLERGFVFTHFFYFFGFLRQKQTTLGLLVVAVECIKTVSKK